MTAETRPVWATALLEQLTAADSPITYGVVKPGDAGDVLFVRGGDIAGGNVREDQLRTITADVSRQYKRTLLRGGELLISLVGQPGQVAVAPSTLAGANIARQVGLIRLKDGVDAQFVSYFLQSPDGNDGLGKFTGGSVQQVINLSDLRQVRVPVPPLAEQHRIVALLDEAFEAIATAKANVETNLRSAHELFASQREALLTSAGHGWGEAQLCDLCDIKHGYAFEGEFFAQEGEHVLLTPGNYFEYGGYRDRGEKQKYFTGPIPSDYILKEGNLLVAMTEQAAGLLGSPLLVPESDRFLHNQRLGLVVGKPGAAWTNDFFFHVFNLKRVRAEIHASASGVKVRHTSPSKIGTVRVAFPTTVAKQREVASRLNRLTAECDRLALINQRKLAALDELKKSLLHQAFTGQITAAKSTKAANPISLLTASPEFTANVICLAFERHKRQSREKTFGHVKAQKVLHLVESIAKVDLGRKPIRDAAGPNDFRHMLNAEDWARANGVFEMVNRGGGYEFRKLSTFDKHQLRARQALEPYLSQLERVIDLLVPMDTEQAEVFATVHAAWNNLLADGAATTDDAIVSAARENWHPDKLKIAEHKFRTAIAFIRQKCLVPDGTAKYVGGQQRLL